jgi:hypothetical protein
MCFGSSCTLSERFSLGVPPGYLKDMQKTGFRLLVTGRGGEVEFRVPGEVITEFLASSQQ